MPGTPAIDISALRPGVWLVELRGEQDFTTSGDLRSRLGDVVDADGHVIIDLAATTFLDSAALAEIVLARQHVDRSANRRFALVVTPDSAPASLLAVVDADGRMFATFPTLDAALRSLDATAPAPLQWPPRP